MVTGSGPSRILPGPDDAPVPRRLVLGVGCQAGIGTACLETALRDTLLGLGLRFSDVAVLASLDRRLDEPALRDLARAQDWRLVACSAADLAAVSVPTVSARVQRATGTPSVAEAAALLAAGLPAHGLLMPRRRFQDEAGRWFTLAIAVPES